MFYRPLIFKKGKVFMPKVGNDGKDIIIFTGQSGIKISNCLNRLKGRKRSAGIFKIENEMIEIYRSRHQDKKYSKDREVVVDILSLPLSSQRKLWEKSFDAISKKVPPVKTSHFNFLTFHASYYHQKNREFISPINLFKLNTLSKRVKGVIVFVDDCYDIYKRLLDEGEMFYRDIFSKEVTPLEAIIKSVWNNLTILIWREIEIAFSRKIAEILGVPLFVVAVKHPLEMINRLVFKRLDSLCIFYVAHPITSIIKKTYARQARFPETLNGFVEDCLKKEKDLVLFIPDTVDELRFKKNGDFYYPELNQAWPVPFGEDASVFEPLPTTTKDVNPLNPKNFTVEEGVTRESISYAIDILKNKIDEQITSRDYCLIEQSPNGVIIYQPYFGGEMSTGALKEAEYNRELIDEGEVSRRTYIFEEPENLAKYRMNELLKDLLSRALKNVDSSGASKLRNFFDELKKNSQIVDNFHSGNIEVHELRSTVERGLPQDYDFSEEYLRSEDASLHGADLYEVSKRTRVGWESLHKKIMSLDPYRKQCYDADKNYFLTRCENFRQHLRRCLRRQRDAER
jgi:hypothetical protein